MNIIKKMWCGLEIVGELRDEMAARWLTLVAPDLLVRLPMEMAMMPVYDDGENIGSAELWNIVPPHLALVFFIVGNENEEHNGWIVRFFPGLRRHDDNHIKLLHNIEKFTGGKLQFITDP